MLNKAILMGRLTRDPELRYTPNGNVPVVTFTVAIDRRYSGGNGGERQTDFINVVAWRKQAEFVSQWFTKGMVIIVTGSIQSRNWQDKNGNNRTSVEVVADDIQFGETKRSREANAGYQGSYDNGYQGGYPNAYAAPQQASRPAPSFDMPAGNSDFSEISDDDGEVPF